VNPSAYNPRHSRQDRQNLKKVVFNLIGASVVVGLFIFLGVPVLARFAIFLGSFRPSVNTTDDKTPPSPPRLSPLPDFVNQKTISVKGFSESASEVELFVNDISLKTIVTEDSGEFIFTDIELINGLNELYVISKDRAGNISQPSGKIMLTLDQEPPEVKITFPKEAELFSGQDNKNIIVKGKTEEEVQVKVNQRSAILKNGGEFEAQISLADGEQEILVVVLDRAGNTTEKKISVRFNP